MGADGFISWTFYSVYAFRLSDVGDKIVQDFDFVYVSIYGMNICVGGRLCVQGATQMRGRCS